MTSARHSSILKRSMQIFAAFLVLTLIGESVANAYQFPLRVNHRMYRIFVPASSVKKTIVSSKAKSLKVNSKVSALKSLPTNAANETGDPITTVTIQATTSASSVYYGSGVNPTIGCQVTPSGYLEERPVASLLNMDGSPASPITVTTPAGTSYIVRCSLRTSSGVVTTNGVASEYVVATPIDANVNVLPRNIEVKATDKNVMIGSDISSSVTLTPGLVNGDAIAPETVSYDPSGTPTLAGTYTIIPKQPVEFTSGSASNYSFTYTNGILIINPLTNISIIPAVSSARMTFGDSTSITSSFIATNRSNLSTEPTCRIYSDAAHNSAVSISSTSDAGTYYVYCSGAVAKTGYSVSYFTDATFTIDPKDITVTAADKTITQGDAFTNSVTLNPSLSGADAQGSASFSYSRAGVPNTTGIYSIIPSALSLSSGRAANYHFTYVSGSLRINARGCVSNCNPTPPPPYVDPTPTPVTPPVEVIPEPTLPQVAKPIVVVTKPKPTKAPKKRFARSGMQSNRVANFVKFSNVTGKSNLIKIPHDAGTKIQLTDGVAASLKTRLKLEITDEGLLITAVNGWTGRISVPVVVTQNGVLVELFIGVVEVPAPVLFPKFYLDDLQSATIKWQPDGSQVVFYNVYLGSKLICTTSNTMCTLVDGLNTHAKLQIEAVGHQQTFSTQVAPTYTNSKLIPADIVHFRTGSAALQPYDKSTLDDLVLAAKNLGLNTIYITGHTDSTGVAALNVVLSKARSLAVKTYIAKFFPKVKIVNKGFAATEPVSTNTTVSGRTNNRRAEVSVG